MKLKKLALATAIASAVSLVPAGQAVASIYAGSSLWIRDLNISFTNLAGPINPQYTFTVEDSASLNPPPTDANSATCGTTTTACSAVSPVLTVDAANGQGSTRLRVDGAADNWSWFGPGDDQYANSDAEITTAQLVQGAPTSVRGMSEGELNKKGGSGTAAANTNINSNTSFTLNFVLDGTGDLSLSFEADPNLYVQIGEGETGDASASYSVSVNLTRKNSIDGFSWEMDGELLGTDCKDSGAIICTELSDTQNLNTTRSVGPTVDAPGLEQNGYSDTRVPAAQDTAPAIYRNLGPGTVFSFFEILAEDLPEGEYSLVLNTKTSVALTRVPEPASLALLATGLIGVGAAGRRTRRQAKMG